MKAAEDSRTPRRCRDEYRATPSARSWSAAVLCRFDFRSLAGGTRSGEAVRLRTSAATVLPAINDHHAKVGHQLLRTNVQVGIAQGGNVDDVRLTNFRQKVSDKFIEFIMPDLD